RTPCPTAVSESATLGLPPRLSILQREIEPAAAGCTPVATMTDVDIRASTIGGSFMTSLVDSFGPRRSLSALTLASRPTGAPSLYSTPSTGLWHSIAAGSWDVAF